MPGVSRKPRRVVTTHTKSGRSTILIDDIAPRTFEFDEMVGMSNALIWGTDGQCRPIDVGPAAAGLSYVPDPGGTRLMIVRFPPDTIFSAPDFDPVEAAREQVACLPGLAELFEVDDPGFHRTPTFDYGIVLDGEIVLQLDETATTLQTGDVVVQNGTRHAWRNPGSAPATVAFILIGSTSSTLGVSDPQSISLEQG